MIKKFTALLIVISILGSVMPAFAEEAERVENLVISQRREVVELSLEKAIEMALTDNPEIIAADAAIKSAELSLVVAKGQTKDYKDLEKKVSAYPGVSMAVDVSKGLEQGYLKHGYYSFAAQVALDIEKAEKEKIISSISYRVTEGYYNVKLMEKLVAIGETGVELAKANAEIVKKNYELGYVSRLEVTNVEAAVKKAESSLKGYKRNLDIARENLNIALNNESDTIFVLTDEIVLLSLPEEIDEKIKAAMETRYDVTALRKAKELKEEYFKITEYYVADTTAMYNSAYSDYIATKYTYENSSKLIALGLKSEYANILSAKESIEDCENTLEIKTIEYESSKIKFEMGMITNLELTGKMAELDSAKVQLENARMTYLLAVLKFGYNTTTGI